MKFVDVTVRLNSCPPLSSVISRYFVGSPPQAHASSCPAPHVFPQLLSFVALIDIACVWSFVTLTCVEWKFIVDGVCSVNTPVVISCETVGSKSSGDVVVSGLCSNWYAMPYVSVIVGDSTGWFMFPSHVTIAFPSLFKLADGAI